MVVDAIKDTKNFDSDAFGRALNFIALIEEGRSRVRGLEDRSKKTYCFGDYGSHPVESLHRYNQFLSVVHPMVGNPNPQMAEVDGLLAAIKSEVTAAVESQHVNTKKMTESLKFFKLLERRATVENCRLSF